MFVNQQTHSMLLSLRHAFAHCFITLLAVVIAFSLPPMARYILYQWWPKVEANAHLLLGTEIALASFLVLAFSIARIARRNGQGVASARLASLVYARCEPGWLSRWRERSLIRNLAAVRDASLLTVTGYDTFVAKDSLLRGALEKAYEIRVMLANPLGESLRRHVEALSPEAALSTYHRDLAASIRYLAGLRKRGKSVTLKFYEHEPFWKLIVLGNHAWVQHFHCGVSSRQQPEYVFALNQRDPKRGLFVPFYAYFLSKWRQHEHPEYDFDANELVYRNAEGNEVRRAYLGVDIDSAAAPETLSTRGSRRATPEPDCAACLQR